MNSCSVILPSPFLRRKYFKSWIQIQIKEKAISMWSPPVHHREHALLCAVAGSPPKHLVDLTHNPVNKALTQIFMWCLVAYLCCSFPHPKLSIQLRSKKIPHSFISLLSMLPLPSLSYIRNTNFIFSSGLPVEVRWITFMWKMFEMKPMAKVFIEWSPWRSHGSWWCCRLCWKPQRPSTGEPDPRQN